jgi:ribonucleotide monophosphatase NagD (HAD superfamily)
MTYCFDIDGTICSNTNGNYDQAQPIYERIKIINKLYDEGNEIIFFTARGTTTKIDWKELTEKQLKDWNVNFHKLIFGKPNADIFIDDKGISDKLFFDN